MSSTISRIVTGAAANDAIYAAERFAVTRVLPLASAALTGLVAMVYSPGLGGPLEEITAADGTVYSKHSDELLYKAVGENGEQWTTVSPQDDIEYRMWLANGGDGAFEEWISNGRPNETASESVVFGKKPYSDPSQRPKYGELQVEEVWESAKQLDGNVYDPNTGELLKWDKSKSRAGQWDMGHKPGHEYRKLHKDYIDGKISKDEFLAAYRDPNNYQPESPSANRSHRYEDD